MAAISVISACWKLLSLQSLLDSKSGRFSTAMKFIWQYLRRCFNLRVSCCYREEAMIHGYLTVLLVCLTSPAAGRFVFCSCRMELSQEHLDILYLPHQLFVRTKPLHQDPSTQCLCIKIPPLRNYNRLPIVRFSIQPIVDTSISASRLPAVSSSTFQASPRIL